MHQIIRRPALLALLLAGLVAACAEPPLPGHTLGQQPAPQLGFAGFATPPV